MEAFGSQPSLPSFKGAISVKLSAKDPHATNNISGTGGRHKRPDLVLKKSFIFLRHGISPFGESRSCGIRRELIRNNNKGREAMS